MQDKSTDDAHDKAKIVQLKIAMQRQKCTDWLLPGRHVKLYWLGRWRCERLGIKSEPVRLRPVIGLFPFSWLSRLGFEKVGAIPLNNFSDSSFNFGVLLWAKNKRGFPACYASLFCCNFLHSVSKESLMVQVDRRQRGDNDALIRYDIRRVQAATHADLEDDEIDWDTLKDSKCSHRQKFKATSVTIMGIIYVLNLQPSCIVHFT
jgi:hypothetical protein